MSATPVRTPILGALLAVLLATLLGAASAPLAGAALQAPLGSLPPAGTPVILVTGSTDGLGREVARRLAADGAHLIVHGRNVERGAEVVAEIEAAGVGSARFYTADFGDLDQVRGLARAILADYDRLDALVNNAGIWLEPAAGRVLSVEGHELHFQVNYLSTFLLTRSLLPLLLQSAPSRIVHVASLAANPIDFGNVMLEREYSDGRAYGQSKLAQVLFNIDLAQELEGTEVISVALHPATMMNTNMVLERGAATRSTVDEGAEALHHLITAEGLESGAFFNGMNPARANAQAYDEEARRQLRSLSFELTGLMAPAAMGERSDPGRGPWVRVPRAEVAAACGMEPAVLEAADRTLAETPFAVVRYGRLCWESGATDETYAVASITKTMGALLFGIVSGRSSLSDEDPVTRWIAADDLGQINPQARIAHILSMTSTKPDLSWGNKGDWAYDASGNREINRLVGVMNRAIAQEPARFSGSSNLCEVAQRDLFDRLGMVGSAWCSEAIGFGMQSTVRDMARMGLLILQRGWYDGERLIDEEYIYRMTHPAFPDTNTAYGYLFYNNTVENGRYSTGVGDPEGTPVAVWPEYPHRPFFEATHCNGGSPDCAVGLDVGANWAQGAGGQRIVVHPGLDLVLVIRDDASNLGHTNVWNAVRPALLPFDPLFAGDPEGFGKAYAGGRHAPDLLGVRTAGR